MHSKSCPKEKVVTHEEFMKQLHAVLKAHDLATENMMMTSAFLIYLFKPSQLEIDCLVDRDFNTSRSMIISPSRVPLHTLIYTAGSFTLPASKKFPRQRVSHSWDNVKTEVLAALLPGFSQFLDENLFFMQDKKHYLIMKNDRDGHMFSQIFRKKKITTESTHCLESTILIMAQKRLRKLNEVFKSLEPNYLFIQTALNAMSNPQIPTVLISIIMDYLAVPPFGEETIDSVRSDKCSWNFAQDSNDFYLNVRMPLDAVQYVLDYFNDIKQGSAVLLLSQIGSKHYIWVKPEAFFHPVFLKELEETFNQLPEETIADYQKLCGTYIEPSADVSGESKSLPGSSMSSSNKQILSLLPPLQAATPNSNNDDVFAPSAPSSSAPSLLAANNMHAVPVQPSLEEEKKNEHGSENMPDLKQKR